VCVVWLKSHEWEGKASHCKSETGPKLVMDWLATFSCCFLNPPRADTARTYADTFDSVSQLGSDTLEIRHPPAFGLIIGVTDSVAH
jgi:hypothetical protein